MFASHCEGDDLVEHYNEFVKIMQLDSNYLLHIGMDGLNINLSFENKFATNLEEMDTTFLRIGSCSLHLTHTAFQKGIKNFIVARLMSKNHNIMIFMTFLMIFLFQSARREDCVSLEAITNVANEYAKKQRKTR